MITQKLAKQFRCAMRNFSSTALFQSGSKVDFTQVTNCCTVLIFKSMQCSLHCLIIRWSISALFLPDKWLCCYSSIDLLFNLSIGKQRAGGCNGNDRDASIHSMRQNWLFFFTTEAVCRRVKSQSPSVLRLPQEDFDQFKLNSYFVAATATLTCKEDSSVFLSNMKQCCLSVS